MNSTPSASDRYGAPARPDRAWLGSNPAPPEDGFLPAIYEFLDDDTLKICYPESGVKKDTAPKDRPRPARFYSDGDRNLWVMKRQPTGASKEPVKP